MSKALERSRVSRSEYRVSMRDGICLATDVYFPEFESTTTSWPVILERTPYNKRGTSRWEYLDGQSEHALTRVDLARAMAAHGFVVVMQDCRGRYRSDGEFTKYVNEANDGFDTLEWLGAQSWCDSNIGTMGMSYGAHTQASLAALNPPNLKCMILDSGGFWNAFHEGIRQGGAFELKQAVWAHRHAVRQAQHAGDSEQLSALLEQDLKHWFSQVPWRRGHSPVSAAPDYEDYMFEQWINSEYSDYWKSPGLAAEEHYQNFPDIPVMVVGSWFDPYVRTSTKHFAALAEKNNAPVQLIMGPWTHGAREREYAGDVSFGAGATFYNNFGESFLDYRLNWFKSWLRSDSICSQPENDVQYFLMGGGSGQRDNKQKIQHGGGWSRSDSYPPTGGEDLRLYLTKPGLLSNDRPKHGSIETKFRYDPQSPTPTIGGAITSGEPVMSGGSYDQVERADFFGCDKPGRPLIERDDVVCFETPPLEQALAVVGEIEARLWVSSDCPDTDFHIRLIDVYPTDQDGRETAINIAHGLIRVRYRNSWTTPEMMEPGVVYPVSFKLTPTANLFQAGNRLRIMIAGSNFPHFDVNPNTGERPGEAQSTRIAVNKIHMSENYPSQLIIPVAIANGDQQRYGEPS